MPEMMMFPTLYKRSSSGALQQWRIWVEKCFQKDLHEPGDPQLAGIIHTEHGQVDGKLQTGEDVVRQGKNLGKKNETDAYQQACLEAEALWRKKKERNGYVVERERAEAGEDDAEGGIFPMLAKSLEDVPEKKRTWPYDYQRKFNGVRCIVEVVDGKVSLWSRKRKRILGVPHIQAAYEAAFRDVPGRFTLDGEIYRHGWSLQKISGYVRKEKTKPDFEQLGHFVYDLPVNSDFANLKRPWRVRRGELDEIFTNIIGLTHDHIHRVETISVASESEARAIEKKWVGEGYEGGILRDPYGEYEAGKRSSGLMKVKSFIEREFPIVAVGEGRGKFEGLAVFTCKTDEVFTCKTDEGKEFDCCAPGNFEDRAEFLRLGDKLIGKLLTVKFFEWTEDKKPCFPVGVAVRIYE
jgi:DNA ligase-1